MGIKKNIYIKIKSIYKQFGLFGFCKRVLKSVLRKNGIVYESFNYYSTRIEKELLVEIMSKYKFLPKKLVFDDFKRGDENFFTEKKMSVIRERFQKGTYEAYGIFDNEILICSSWVSYEEFTSSAKGLESKLDIDESLVLDSYTTPSYRGNGMQTFITAYILNVAYEKGKSKAITLVLTDNTPSNRAQIKVGFKKAFKYTVFSIFGKLFTNYLNKKSCFLNQQK